MTDRWRAPARGHGARRVGQAAARGRLCAGAARRRFLWPALAARCGPSCGLGADRVGVTTKPKSPTSAGRMKVLSRNESARIKGQTAAHVCSLRTIALDYPQGRPGFSTGCDTVAIGAPPAAWPPCAGATCPVSLAPLAARCLPAALTIIACPLLDAGAASRARKRLLRYGYAANLHNLQWKSGPPLVRTTLKPSGTTSTVSVSPWRRDSVAVPVLPHLGQRSFSYQSSMVTAALRDIPVFPSHLFRTVVAW